LQLLEKGYLVHFRRAVGGNGDSEVEESKINDLPDSREAVVTDSNESVGLAFNRSEEVDLVD